MRKSKKLNLVLFALLLALVLVVSSCATGTSVKAKDGGSINEKFQQTATSPNIKKMISVAKFSTAMAEENTSRAYAAAAYDTLVNKLQATGKFIVFEESEFDTLNQYIKSTGKSSINKRLAQYMIVGSVNSVASKSTGVSLGIIKTKNDTIEASVTLRLIDTSTGQIVYSEEGQGTSKNTSAGISYLGAALTGGGYDPESLESKAIGAAIDSLINNIIKTCDQDPWKSDIFADSGNLYIIGGESIGLEKDDVFAVYKRGGTITNPQTGAVVELPGEKVAQATIISTYPASLPENEISLIVVTSGTVDFANISNYYIREE